LASFKDRDGIQVILFGRIGGGILRNFNRVFVRAEVEDVHQNHRVAKREKVEDRGDVL
jgi:hypothetical protein